MGIFIIVYIIVLGAIFVASICAEREANEAHHNTIAEIEKQREADRIKRTYKPKGKRK